MIERKMRILGISRDKKACDHYRVDLPLTHIEDQELADVTRLAFETSLDSDEAIQAAFETDIILLPRPSSEEWFSFVKAARKAGKIVVADYDDDPFTCSPLNPYYRWIGIKEWSHPEFGKVWTDGAIEKDGIEWFNIEKNMNRRDMVRAAFKKSDMVTCTTPELQEVFKKINPNTVILPNYINIDIYPRIDMVKKKVRIGWQGGVSHYEDLYNFKGVFEEISKRDDVEIVYFGDTRMSNMFKDCRNIEVQDWVSLQAYPYKLACLNIDIGVCPLVDNVFNRCKSAIKYYEYSAVGACTVASDMPPYSNAITNYKDGILVPADNKSWVDALVELIENPKKRLGLRENAYDNIRENYTIQKNAHKWVDAYKELINKECELQVAK